MSSNEKNPKSATRRASSTHAPRPDRYDETEIPSVLDELFDRLIQENPRVCSTCFSRLARRERFPDKPGFEYGDMLSFVEKNLPDDADWDIIDIEYHEHVTFRERSETAHPPGRLAAQGSVTACSTCGTCHPQADPPPRSYDDTLEHALNLSITLSEYGVSHDYITLLERVKAFKTTPRLASRDRDIFAAATAISIADAVDKDLSTLVEPSDSDSDD